MELDRIFDPIYSFMDNPEEQLNTLNHGLIFKKHPSQISQYENKILITVETKLHLFIYYQPHI